MKQECALELGPEVAARQFYLESRDQSSNPYPLDSDDHRKFAEEMSKQYQNEFINLMVGGHG